MNPSSPTAPPPFGLANLHEVPLDARHQAILEAAKRGCGGPVACRQRQGAEAHDLLALAQLSGRLQVHWLDLAAGLRAQVEMQTPVPCLPDPAGPVRIAPRALLGLRYPQEAMFTPQPGYAFVCILLPRQVWLSNVSHDANQALCLGARLPAGIPLKEIVLMTYGALTMQTTQLDLLDPAGVLNAEAALWWQLPNNTRQIPLSREPFLLPKANHAA